MLLKTDVNISANDYVHVEDENNWTILTDEDVIELVNREDMSSESEAETVEKLETISNRTASTSIDTVLKFLYQQGPEFGEVVEEVKILRALRRRVELVIQKNLKQVSLHHFEDKMIEQ